MNLKGNWAGYIVEMRQRYGEDVVNDLIDVRSISKVFNVIELEEMFETYKAKVKELEKITGKIW